MKRTTAILLAFITLATGFYMGQRSIVDSSETPLDVSMANSVWQIIQSKYLWAEDVSRNQLKYGLAKGIVSSLDDPHSTYMNPEEAESFLVSLNGDLEGIGATLRLDEGVVYVVNPLPDSPAKRAGIRPGDIILQVDGKRLGEVENLMDVVMKIRGEKGTEVVLNVLHEDEAKAEDVRIVREAIHIPAVQWEVRDYQGQSIAVLTLSSFTEVVGDEFAEALAEINAAGHDKLILDLRFNGGGYLDGAIDVSSHFMDPDMAVVHIRDQQGTKPRVTHAVDERYSGEIVVLVNNSSASASEIVAGALQDYDLAHVIGNVTFGKGTVQEVHPFFDSSLIRITVAEWLTPLKRSIEGNGIEPDEIIDLDLDQYQSGDDSQLNAALEYLLKM